MKIIKLSVGDRVEMKKQHPCGGKIFTILRAGSDVRAVCETCKHDMTIDRIKFEKSIKTIVFTNNEEQAK